MQQTVLQNVRTVLKLGTHFFTGFVLSVHYKRDNSRWVKLSMGKERKTTPIRFLVDEYQT